MSHHAVPHDDDLLEPGENLTDFLGREPAHVAVQRDEGAIKSNASAAGKGAEKVHSRRAERGDGGVQV